jgi:hypothetical protein
VQVDEGLRAALDDVVEREEHQQREVRQAAPVHHHRIAPCHGARTGR